MTGYWAEHAHLPDGTAAGVRFSVEGDRFGEVRARTRPVHGDEVLTGVVLPGFANGHSHAFHRVLRGRTHSGGGTFWTWREQMYVAARALDPDTYLALARGVFAEMVLAGYTAVGEFHYVHHAPGGAAYADPNAMGESLIQAAREAGIRLTLLDTCYLSGGLQGDGHLPLDEVQTRFSDGTVEAWAARVEALPDTSTSRVGLAVHSVRAVPRDALAEVARAASALGGRPLHLHLSEQPAENLAAQMHYGCTPTELLEGAGLLGPDLTAVHATHLSERDIGLLGGAGATACFCPTTERDLADGIGPARALAAAGCRLTLGSDQNAVIDPFEEVRGLEMHERLVTGERGRFTPAGLVNVATHLGYASLGWDGGRLAPGALADFVVVRDDSPRTVGSRADQVAYAATASDVRMVVVGGEVVVRDGQHRLGPVAPLLRHAFDRLRGSA